MWIKREKMSKLLWLRVIKNHHSGVGSSRHSSLTINSFFYWNSYLSWTDILHSLSVQCWLPPPGESFYSNRWTQILSRQSWTTNWPTVYRSPISVNPDQPKLSRPQGLNMFIPLRDAPWNSQPYHFFCTRWNVWMGGTCSETSKRGITAAQKPSSELQMNSEPPRLARERVVAENTSIHMRLFVSAPLRPVFLAIIIPTSHYHFCSSVVSAVSFMHLLRRRELHRWPKTATEESEEIPPLLLGFLSQESYSGLLS